MATTIRIDAWIAAPGGWGVGYIDVGADLITAQTRDGRGGPLELSAAPPEATIVLDNTAGTYTNLLGAGGTSYVKIGDAVALDITFNDGGGGVSMPLYDGWIVNVAYGSSASGGVSTCTITCSAARNITRQNANANAIAAGSVSSFLADTMTYGGYAFTYNLSDTATPAVGAGVIPAGTEWWTMANTVAFMAGGIMYWQGADIAAYAPFGPPGPPTVLRGIDHPAPNYASKTSRARKARDAWALYPVTIGDADTGEEDVEDVTIVYDEERTATKVTVSDFAGALTTPTTVDLGYTKSAARELALVGPWTSAGTQQAIADDVAKRYNVNRVKPGVRGAVCEARFLSNSTLRTIFDPDYPLRTIKAVQRQSAGTFYDYCYIEGRSVDVGPDSCRITLDLTPTESESYAILGVKPFNRLGYTTLK